jgi:hypothetical protein
MKNFEYRDIYGLEEIDTPEQLDTFDPEFVNSRNNRWIFNFSNRPQPDIIAIQSYANTDTNNVIDDGETVFDNANGYIYKYGLKNQTANEGPPMWPGPGGPSDGNLYFRDHITIRNAYSDPNIAFPTLSYQDSPATKFFGDYAIDGDLNLEDRNINQQSGIPNIIEAPAKPSFLHQVPIINKDIAFNIGKNKADIFRVGHFEFSIKTDNQNCIIAYGSNNNANPSQTTIDDKINVRNEYSDGHNEIKIETKNGKLLFTYEDLSSQNQQSFSIMSNKTIADNQWHHVVINFGKKGILTKNRKKANKRYLEFWVDGKLDIVDYEVLNKKQIYIPIISWFFIDPTKTISKRTKDDLWRSYDTKKYMGAEIAGQGGSPLHYEFPGLFEFNLEFFNGDWNSDGDSVAFTGSMYIFCAGFNSLSPKEIQLRYSLLFDDFPITALPITASAVMVDPTINANKKRALKLFWNNLKENKNGIELDNNYLVDSISVSHKNKISKTETYNIDLSNIKEIKFLTDVRAVFTDNINIFGPGKVWNMSQRKVQMSPDPFHGIKYIPNGGTFADLDSVRWNDYNPPKGYAENKTYDDYPFSDGALIDLPFSGITLLKGDRILLTNQSRERDNGIYVFNGYNELLTRATDSDSPAKLNNAVVRIVDGLYKDTSWILTNNISSIGDVQIWTQLQNHPTSENINTQPIFIKRWSNQDGTQRLIDLEQDIDIESYDLIVFMNYPETHEDLKNNFDNLTELEINTIYNNFIKSLQNVCANGASLYVSSPKLAQDLGIIKSYKLINQMLETSDAQAAAISPFEINEPASEYFDTHRINQYQLQTEIAGLTNKETYILTDFINYVPSNINEPQQYHAKYAYRQLGLKEGNQFFIPSLSLLKITENDKLPGFAENRRGSKDLVVVEPNQINIGTIVTKLQNTYYQNGQIVNNLHDDDATTIIVHNGQILNGQPITGKIFINFIEDGYTMSRKEYNKARIQIVPQNDTNETIATRAWQYSTTRLNRLPQRINIRELTQYGQTTPTNGGGGPFIQSPSNSSNGMIRSLTDSGNIDYQSDLYPTEAEEIYPTQEIPVLSMTYLGLQWLAE